jgi:serine/threonine-protein kinase
MGEVYSAYDTILHRKVALKVLTTSPGFPGEGPPSTRGAARILREARAAAGITHPNAVSIYDVGEVEGVSFLAMELVSGRTLRSLIGDGSVTFARRIRWITDVARALGAAHQLGLIHRDIKPENVMVRDDGFVKVLDFGIARRAVGSEAPVPPGKLDLAALEQLAVSRGTLTAEGVVVGTPMYMAPEQMRGEALDGRTDQFAWGVLAYEVLTGKIPWEGEGVMMLSQILSQEVAPMKDEFPDVPEAVDAVIRTALRKLPADRFATMEDIAQALEPFASSTAGTTIRPPEASARDPAFAPTEQISSSAGSLRGALSARTNVAPVEPRRRWWAGAGGVAIAVAVVVGVAGVSRLVASPRAARALPDAAPAAEPPSLMSTNAEATAAYRAGVQALRDASITSAERQLTHAIELDPMFALARLRLALLKIANSGESITSGDLQPARDSRASLGERDRLILDALEPFALTPPDLKESRRLFEAAAQKYPGDADLLFQLALVLDNASEPRLAATQLDAVVTLDPTLALAWMVKGEIDIETGDVPGAFAAYAQCLKISPAATSCLSDLATVQSNEGKCEELVSTSRRLITLAPGAPQAYQWLAEALVGSDQPLDAVRAALQQKWDHEEPSLRRSRQLWSEASLGIISGDFVGAERSMAELDKSTASDADDAIRFQIAYARMLLDLETGRSTQAAHLAALYLRQRAAWPGASAETLIAAQSVELAAGAISRPKFDELRDQWLAQNPNEQASNRWIEAFAVPAQTHDDGVAALAAKPDVQPLVNALNLEPYRAEPIGRVYVLAGQLDDGEPFLSEASAACGVIDGRAAIFSTWASLRLGQVLEARGDKAGACSAYGRVVARWGKASPSSRTAAMAAARRRVLSCAP